MWNRQGAKKVEKEKQVKRSYHSALLSNSEDAPGVPSQLWPSGQGDKGKLEEQATYLLI